MGEMEDIVDLVSLSDDELKQTIRDFEAEEHDLSRQRRILHGKLDILRAELVLRMQREHQEGKSVITGRDVALLIGGPDGLDPAVKASADETLRLSDLTLPHAFARVLLAEALYRAWSVTAGHPYHRE